MYNTREKLIELLQDCMCDYVSAVNYEWWTTYEVEYEALADHLIANGVTVQKWIPVTERLPENDYGKHWKERQYYLVKFKTSGLMCVAHYGYKEYDWWIDEHDCVLSARNYKEVTQWMPLLEKPKGD